MHKFLKCLIVMIILCVLTVPWSSNYLTAANYFLFRNSFSIKQLSLFAKSSSTPALLRKYGALSKDMDLEKISIAVVSCGDRLKETLTMVKSAILFSKGLMLHLILFADDETLYPFDTNLKLLRAEARKLNVFFRYEIHPIVFPPKENSDEWIKLFKPCAAQRLFLPSVLPHVDALLYLDTDTLIMSDIRSVWAHFQKMNSSQLIGVTQENESHTVGWYNRFAKHPFYPPLGVNSGVMLMNLTRLREFDWETKVISYYKQYRSNLVFGDQDLINIIFHFYPGELYLYSCGYNYRPDHCIYGSNCKAAEANGIYIIHGNRGVFHNSKVIPFRTVYQVFQKFNLSRDGLQQDLIEPVKRKVAMLKGNACSEELSTFVFKGKEQTPTGKQNKDATLI